MAMAMMGNNTQNQQNQQMQQEMLLADKHQSTIQSIKQLQDMEKYMFQNLNREMVGATPDVAAQEEIMNRINELSTMRIELFQKLKDNYGMVSDELNQDRNSLADQITMTNIVEHELNQLKKNIDSLQQDKNKKLRLVEIGEYQYKRYDAHSKIMRVIALASIVILVASVLLQKRMIPSFIATISIISAVAYTLIYLAMTLPDILARNKFDYDKFNFFFDSKQYSPNYETVLQHDKRFFHKLKGEVEDGYRDAKKSFQDTVSGLQKVSSSVISATSDELSGLTKGSLGKPNDTVSANAASSTGAGANGVSPVSGTAPQPSQSQTSTVENFQVIG
jgi:hypothetical protein